MKIHLKKLLIAIGIPLLVGGLSALLTMGSMSSFEEVRKPPLSPPSWLFPVVWTILFILMGIASYLIVTAEENTLKLPALVLYGTQLFFNFFWSIIFFNLEAYLFAFVWLIILWLLILATIVTFYKISKPAAFLLIPYLLWVTFAGYLNFGIFLLNR